MADINAFEKNQETKTVDTSRKMRIGIIGTGWIAGAHIEAYLRQPDVEIVAGADLVPGKAEAFMKKYGVEGAKTHYKNDREMIDDKSLKLDAVSICTYNREHAGPAIYALSHGVNVLLEKPMCVTTEEAVEIVKAEKASGKVLSIGFQPRFDANMQMIKKIVQSGELGKIYYVQTGGGRRRGIPVPFGTTFIEDKTAGLGALADLGCYSLDLVLNALGYPKPVTVSGYKSDFFGKDPKYSHYQKIGHPEYAEKFEVDDFAAAFVRLEDGTVVDFRISWAMNMDTSGDTIFLGTKGGLRVPSTECWNGTFDKPLKVYHEVAGNQVETEIPLLPATSGDQLWDLKVRYFLDAIKEGGVSPVPSSEIIYNQAILDAIAKSSDLGREVEIKIPEI